MSTELRPRRKPALKLIGFVLLLALVTAGSLMVYLVERDRGQREIVLGDTTSANRLDVSVFVQKTDAVLQEISAQVEVSPQGALADANGLPAKDVTLYTNGVKGDVLPFKAGKTPSVADLRVAMNEGVITDYPFDSYEVDFGFAAEVDGTAVPVTVTLVNADSFFRLTLVRNETTNDALMFSAAAERSVGTFAFALFIMVFMWFLSLAAVIAAWFAMKGRHGLLWPSMSFMGALLFALVPLRNAVPGQPPVGSVVDFGAFFLAEALISLSLITTVVVGYRVERAKEREKAAAEAAERESIPAGPGPLEPVGSPGR
ncbi:DUF4436 family protein [Lentzea sp. NPDC060358]|uniref:DUF4436 family protein n=1 Tax=Lentzea sp. NPDC060358 TaxID=3347103 RepID=UPI003663C81D